MVEVRKSTLEFYVVQFLGKDYQSQEVEWRDKWEYNNIRHINEATRILGKLQRRAMYEKTGEQFRVLKRTIEIVTSVENEILDIPQ